MHLNMKFAVDSLPFLIHQFEGVASITIHVLIPIGNAAITEQEANLMSGFRAKSDEIPEHVRVLQKFKMVMLQ